MSALHRYLRFLDHYLYPLEIAYTVVLINTGDVALPMETTFTSTRQACEILRFQKNCGVNPNGTFWSPLVKNETFHMKQFIIKFKENHTLY